MLWSAPCREATTIPTAAQAMHTWQKTSEAKNVALINIPNIWLPLWKLKEAPTII